MERNWMTKNADHYSARAVVCADGRVSKRTARWLIKLGQDAEGRLWNSYTWGTKFPDLPKS